MFYVAVSLIPLLPQLLQKIGIDIGESLTGSFAMSLLAALVGGLLSKAWVPPFQRWICEKSLPVNTKIRQSHLQVCERYREAITRRIKNILPEELWDAWRNNPNLSKSLMSLRAEELASTEIKRAPAGRIQNVFHFLDREYFFNVGTKLQPITIQGEPGSGKSTLVFELYRQHAHRLSVRKQGWIPLFVFAHELSWDLLEQQTSLRDLLIAYFARCFQEHESEGYRAIRQLIADHYDDYQFAIIIDGLDEITDRPLYEKITRKINELLEGEWAGENNYLNRYVLSCRTDDNQKTVTSTLLSLLPVDYDTIIKHLKFLRAAYHKNSPSKEQQTRSIIIGLEASKTNRLLQNYITNPYLLSLIREYFKDEDNPPARTLNQIFEGVLQRELAKPRREFEKETSRKTRSQLLAYLTSLLAPYCYFRTIDSLESGNTGREQFKRYLQYDAQLAETLFGIGGSLGYLQGVYADDSLVRENRIRNLNDIWGDQKTTEFRDYLTSIKNSCATFKDFVDRAVLYLHHDVFKLLKECALADVDNTGEIRRFRHRRMQDYFMARFVDRVGILDEHRQPIIPLANAWMREPIRILAAISSHPAELVAAFYEAYQRQNAIAPYDNDGLSKLTDLMLNASEAVGYLPKPPEQNSDDPLYKTSVDLGVEAQRLYSLASSSPNTKPGLMLQLSEKCFEILKNIYASEYLRNDASLFTLSFPLGDGAENSWRLLHADLQWQPDSYQHMAYSYLYAIKRAQRNFPLSGANLSFYILDAVFCFSSAYDRLIRDTHPQRSTRFVFWLGSKIESLFSLALVAMIVVLAWGPFDQSQSLGFKALRVGIVLTVFFIVAWGAQIFGLMHWSQVHHSLDWIILKLAKKIVVVGKALLPIVARVPFFVMRFLPRNLFRLARLIFLFLWRDLLPLLGDAINFVGTAVTSFLSWPMRHPRGTLKVVLGLIIIAATWVYVIPSIVFTYRSWEYASQVQNLSDRVDDLSQNYRRCNDEISHLANTVLEATPERQSSLTAQLDQYDKDIKGLLSEGETLSNPNRDYSEESRNTAIHQVQLLKLMAADIGNVRESLVEIGQRYRVEAVKKILTERSAQLLAQPTLTDLGPKFDSIAEALRFGEGRFTNIKLNLSDDSSGWAPALYQQYQFRKDEKYLEDLQVLNSSIPAISKELDDYEIEISSHLEALNDAQQPGSEALQARLSKIEQQARQVRAYSELYGRLRVDELQSQLKETRKKNDERVKMQGDYALYLLTFFPIGFVALLLVRHFGDKSGEKKLKVISGDFERLVQFVKRNRYSLTVNIHAIAFMRNCAPATYDSVRLISDAADARLKRSGEVNERIGNLLRETVKGIDNILNRQSA